MVKVLVVLQQYQKCIGIGIDIAIIFRNLYWYCQYFLKVLLTALT